jgi:hypothetical protein
MVSFRARVEGPPGSLVAGRMGGRAIAAIAVAMAVAILAVAGAAPASAAPKPRPPTETVGPAGVLGWDLGPGAKRRGRPPTDSSGAFVYRKGRYSPLGAIPGAALLGAIPGFPDATVFDTHFAINDRGETAGFYSDAVPGPDGTPPPDSTHGFVKSRRGGVASFDVPGASYLLAKGNNNHGEVVGTYVDAVPGEDGTVPPGSVHGFVRDRHGAISTFDVPFFRLHDVADINERRQMVGYYDKPDGAGGGAFLREPTGAITRIEVPGALVTTAHAINNRGRVVGAYLEPGVAPNPDGTVPANTVHGFVWEKGRITRFDVPRSIWTQPFGINKRGQISGGYYDAAGKQHGFLLERGRYKTLDAPGRTDNIAWGINDRGQVVIPEDTVRLLPVAVR